MKVALLLVSLFINPNGKVTTDIEPFAVESMSVCREYARVFNKIAEEEDKAVHATCEVLKTSKDFLGS